MAQQISLRGEWQRWINGALFDHVPVPSSQHPTGFYSLRRPFSLRPLSAGERAFVRFEAIAYHGRVSINGVELGVMGPYVPYEFEITQQARAGENQIEVAIADLAPEPGGAGREEIALGHTAGWEAHGGILRDVWIVYRQSVFVRNVRLSYDLAADYSKAQCRLQIYVSSTQARRDRLVVMLSSGETEVAKTQVEINVTAGESEAEAAFELPNPALWSPDEANLYTLRATFDSEGDGFECRTGFRHLEIRGNTFVLNGQPLTLAGVCRHDMWLDQGFTLTPEQMRRDMKMIKAMGANFVRLVHYPHDRLVVHLAEELGLLVTEEPGFWQVDFGTIPRGRIDAGLRVLEQVIRRDWNSPAVMAWILGNESVLTVAYLKEGKALCNRLDPLKRFVSFANHIKMEVAKPIFEQAGLDFFSQHLYDFSNDKFAKTAAFYGNSKPLVLTEWGWEVVGGPQVIYERTFDPLLAEVKKGGIAGHAFWSWQDVREYSRTDWATKDGILLSGVVSENREPRERLYVRLTSLFLGHDELQPASDVRPEIYPLRSSPWAPNSRFQPIDLQPICDVETSRKAWGEMESELERQWRETPMARNHWTRSGSRFRLWRDTPVSILGARFRIPVLEGLATPLVVTAGVPEIRIPVGVACRALHVLGNVTLPKGYPVSAKKGEAWGVCRVRYSSGKTQEIPLRHGVEVVRANMIFFASRIDPTAVNAPRALTYIKDSAREHLQALLFSIPLQGGAVSDLTYRLHPGQPPLAIFAVTSELG